MIEKYEICRDFFHGFDWKLWTTGKAAQRLGLLPLAQEHILKPTGDETPDEKKTRYLQAVTELSKAFALSVPHEKALAIRDDVGFFQAVRAALAKSPDEAFIIPPESDGPVVIADTDRPVFATERFEAQGWVLRVG